MSKPIKTSPPGGVPLEARIIYDYQIRDLEGKLLTFIESLGLRESQEKSAKDIFRSIYHHTQYNETLWASGDMIGPVVEAVYKESRETNMLPTWERYPRASGN